MSLLCARRGKRSATHGRVSLTTLLRNASKAWHGITLGQPDWSDNSLSVALSGELREEGFVFYLMLNAFWEPLEFELPPAPAGSAWQRWIDTSLESPEDIHEWERSPQFVDGEYRVSDRSVVMLYSLTGN